MKWYRFVSVVAATVLAVTASAARADVFNMGPGLTNLNFVPVGNAGNAADTRVMNDGTTGYGSVAKDYQIGKYEVTNAQYREFLNAKAAVGDPNGLYHMGMNGTYGGIAQSGSGTSDDKWVYSAKDGDANWDNRPVNYVSFWDAARFVNWLHNGQGGGDTESGAYTNIDNQSMFARQAGAKYWIPSENEWYKAAYHTKNDGVAGNYFDYPTGSDSLPSNKLISPDLGNNANFYQDGYTIDSPYYSTVVGEFENSDSPYGTFDQGGNLVEWNEAAMSGSLCALRGGWWRINSKSLLASSRYFLPTNEADLDIGFRVASAVPEPGSITLMVCGALVGLLWWNRKRKQ